MDRMVKINSFKKFNILYLNIFTNNSKILTIVTLIDACMYHITKNTHNIKMDKQNLSPINVIYSLCLLTVQTTNTGAVTRVLKES